MGNAVQQGDKRIGLACLLIASALDDCRSHMKGAGQRDASSDPGSTRCPGLYERDANLDIANRLNALLDSDGAVVSLTRTDSASNPSNTQRADFANSHNGEVLLSIHLNGSMDHGVDGTIGLWGKRNKDLDFTRVMHRALRARSKCPIKA